MVILNNYPTPTGGQTILQQTYNFEYTKHVGQIYINTPGYYTIGFYARAWGALHKHPPRFYINDIVIYLK